MLKKLIILISLVVVVIASTLIFFKSNREKFLIAELENENNFSMDEEVKFKYEIKKFNEQYNFLLKITESAKDEEIWLIPKDVELGDIILNDEVLEGKKIKKIGDIKIDKPEYIYYPKIKNRYLSGDIYLAIFEKDCYILRIKENNDIVLEGIVEDYNDSKNDIKVVEDKIYLIEKADSKGYEVFFVNELVKLEEKIISNIRYKDILYDIKYNDETRKLEVDILKTNLGFSEFRENIYKSANNKVNKKTYLAFENQEEYDKLAKKESFGNINIMENDTFLKIPYYYIYYLYIDTTTTYNINELREKYDTNFKAEKNDTIKSYRVGWDFKKVIDINSEKSIYISSREVGVHEPDKSETAILIYNKKLNKYTKIYTTIFDEIYYFEEDSKAYIVIKYRGKIYTYEGENPAQISDIRLLNVIEINKETGEITSNEKENSSWRAEKYAIKSLDENNNVLFTVDTKEFWLLDKKYDSNSIIEDVQVYKDEKVKFVELKKNVGEKLKVAYPDIFQKDDRFTIKVNNLYTIVGNFDTEGNIYIDYIVYKTDNEYFDYEEKIYMYGHIYSKKGNVWFASIADKPEKKKLEFIKVNNSLFYIYFDSEDQKIKTKLEKIGLKENEFNEYDFESEAIDYEKNNYIMFRNQEEYDMLSRRGIIESVEDIEKSDSILKVKENGKKTYIYLGKTYTSDELGKRYYDDPEEGYWYYFRAFGKYYFYDYAQIVDKYILFRSVSSDPNEHISRYMVYDKEDNFDIILEKFEDGSDINACTPTRFIETNKCIYILLDSSGAYAVVKIYKETNKARIDRLGD